MKKVAEKIIITSNINTLDIDDFAKRFSKFLTGICCDTGDCEIEPNIQDKSQQIQALTSNNK